MLGWFKKKPAQMNGPDFSGIDSNARAEESFPRGELEKLFLMPLEFGGEEIPPNTVYVPVGVAAIKEGIDKRDRAAGGGGEGHLVPGGPAVPGFERHSDRHPDRGVGPGEFRTTIKIWGEALLNDGDA